MMKDPSKIPPGENCYRLYPLRDGEELIQDVSLFGRSLREFPFLPGWKEVLCPYWQLTDYGTIKCLFLDQEFLNEDHEDSFSLLSEKFGDAFVQNYPRSWMLLDEIKICGINKDKEDPCAYEI